MADELEQQHTAPATPSVSTEAGSAFSGHIDPEEYSQLQAQVAQYQTAFDRLNPQAARIQRLLEDPDAANLFDNAYESYKNLQKSQEPEIPENVRPLYAKVSKLEELADQVLKEREDAANKPQREYQEKWQAWQNSPANDRFYKRLIHDNKDLKARDLQYLAQVAAEKDFAPLEEVWKEEQWRFVPQQRSAPPSSLRSDNGEVGIPGPSQTGTQEKTMRGRLVELERERRARAS
jgi:uncharacterized protein with von Willebrand factor type A (vWA) domain